MGRWRLPANLTVRLVWNPRYSARMNVAAYGEAAVEGFKSILVAVREWRDNPLRSQANRLMWGRWWPVSITLLTFAALAVEAYRPVDLLIGLAPPLAYLRMFPGVVRDLVVSAPALFAFVVAWRVHRLRSSAPEAWPDRAATSDFGGRFFDAGAVPVAVATVALALGCEVVGALADAPTGSDSTAPGMGAVAGLAAAAGTGGFGRTVLVVALVAGILGVHRLVGTGFGKLIGAGFYVWGAHLVIGFTVPWMVSWWTYLPFVGGFVPDRSPDLVRLVFDLGVACAAWMAAREKCRPAPLWGDAPPPPPPPPPTD